MLRVTRPLSSSDIIHRLLLFPPPSSLSIIIIIILISLIVPPSFSVSGKWDNWQSIRPDSVVVDFIFFFRATVPKNNLHAARNVKIPDRDQLATGPN